MNPLIRKEIRLILPAWITAMTLAIVPVWFFSVNSLTSWQQEGAAIASFAFAVGAIFLGLAPFGQECGAGTFSLLLAQPVTRRRIWRVKTAVVAVALVLAMMSLLLSYHIRIQGAPSREVLVLMLTVSGLSAMAAFAGGLWTTLLFRQVAAALWFSLLVPFVILLATAKVLEKSSEILGAAGTSAALVLYSIAGFLWARRMFLRAQDAQWTGGVISLPARPDLGIRTRSAAEIQKPNPLCALIRKEFQSHHVSLLIGAGLLLMHLVVMVVRKMEFDPGQQFTALDTILEFWWGLWFGLPFLVGSTAVAEERKLGTLESQLCLPTTRRAQFVVKFGLALFLGVFLGGLMSWVAESLGGFDVVPGSFRSLRREAVLLWQPLALTCLVAAGITLVSFYASTLTRNLLQAMGAAVAVGCTLTAIGTWAMMATVDSHRPPPWGIPLIGYIGSSVILAALIWLAFKNYKHVLVGWDIWLRNLATILISLAFALTVSATIYHRPWELLMTLEPRHGPAQLSGSVRPGICSVAGFKLFALLSDGRLWAAGHYEFKEFDEYVERRKENTTRWEKVRIPVPVDGVFLGPSDWVCLANSYSQVVGIQSDGSLWKVFSWDPTVPVWNPRNLSVIPQPQRIGSDSDWKTVAAGSGHFLALKKDGTLWGWGNNREGQIGPGEKEFTNGPVRIGVESDWLATFASGNVSIGIKGDGSVWKWGRLDFGPNGFAGWKQGPHPHPVRWNLDGTGWLALTGETWFDLALRQDGTLWAAGNLPQNLFGKHFDRGFSPQFSRIGRGSDWADLAGSYRSLVATKKDGTLVLSDVDAGSVFWPGHLRKPSKYSDWIAVGVCAWKQDVALAADGTLCVWGDLFRVEGLLGPTRKPLWNINILAAPNQGGLATPGQP